MVSLERFWESVGSLKGTLQARYGLVLGHRNIKGQIQKGEIEIAAKEEIARQINPLQPVADTYDAGKDLRSTSEP